jgi:hypothetical protein
MDNDDEAYHALAARLVGDGSCDVIERGTVVSFEDEKVFHDISQVRAVGSPDSYWVGSGVTDKAKPAGNSATTAQHADQ